FTFYNLLKITYNFNYDLLFGLTWAYVILYFTKNMIKNIKNNLIPILYYLGIISLFALFILYLNLLIFIINIIILLNVLFVICYCLLFYLYISNIFINIFKFLKYLYNLTYYYIFSSYFFHIFLLKKIISLFITILLIMFSNKIYLENFVSYIFSLNPLIFI